MTSASYRTSAAEMAAIHFAVCRARKQALVCGTCCELAERCRTAQRDDICAAPAAARIGAQQSEAA